MLEELFLLLGFFQVGVDNIFRILEGLLLASHSVEQEEGDGLQLCQNVEVSLLLPPL